MEVFFKDLMSWALIGIILFSILVYVYSQTGMFYTRKDEEGNLRKEKSLKGFLSSFFILIGLFLIQFLYSFISLRNGGFPVTFSLLYLLNFLLYEILFLYDTFVIDIFVICVWHPEFMNLPETEMYTSPHYHLKTLIPGTAFGIVFCLFSTSLIYAFVFLPLLTL